MQYNGQAQTAKDAHPRMFSLWFIQPWAHTHINTNTHTNAECGRPVVHVLAPLTVGWLVCWTQESDRKEMVCAISPFLALFLPLTVRWMIAITGAISETKWRSMGQQDTAMGIQPSDCCATLPWEHWAVYLSRGFVVSYAFFSSVLPPTFLSATV